MKRFRISQEDLPVVEEQLVAKDLTDRFAWNSDKSSFSITDLVNEQGDDSWEYIISTDRFRINQYTTLAGVKQSTLIVNPEDTLYFESEASTSAPHLYGSEESDLASLKKQISESVGRDVYRTIPESEAASMRGGVTRGIGLGFYMPSETLFGLGEREDTLVLKRTTDSTPYEMWAFDNPHQANKMDGLYGNMPYVQGIGEKSA